MIDNNGLNQIKTALRPIVDPFDTIPNMALERDVSELGLQPTDSCHVGLDTRDAIMRVYDIEEIQGDKGIKQFLSDLTYPPQIDIYYDCEDRALWGAAHVRHKYPGAPIGVLSGTADYDPVKNKEHAVIILWFNGENGLQKEFWDPILKTKVDFPRIKSTMAFPVGKLPGAMALMYDEKRMVYPLNGDGGLLNYLQNKLYENGAHKCNEDHVISRPTAFRDRWMDYDAALWAFAHVRRDYPGCPVGVSIGDVVGANPPSGLVIWYKEGDREGGPLKRKFFDPVEGREFNPRPKMILI